MFNSTTNSCSNPIQLLSPLRLWLNPRCVLLGFTHPHALEQMFSSQTISLGVLARSTADACYEELATLATLPGRPEEERHREAALTLSAVQQRLLRLLVLARWSPSSADTALQLSRVRDMLAQRDATFHDAATRLLVEHHTVSPMAEPLHDVPTALRVLSAAQLGSLPLVPAAVEELRPAAAPRAQAARLEAAVRARLLQSRRPPQLAVLRVVGGLVTLGIAHECEVDLTLGLTKEEAGAGGEAPVRRLGGWAVVRVRLLVQDADAPAACALAQAQQRLLCWEVNKRLAGSPEPLNALHALLHNLCVTLARDVLVRQAKALSAGRWSGLVRLAPLPGAPPPPGFALHYGDGRALLLQLIAGGRQLVCGHEPSLGSRVDGELQPLLNSLSLERLLRASIAAAVQQRLEEAQAALREAPELGGVGCELRRGDTSQEPPCLQLTLPSAPDISPALYCDLRTGALRLRGVAAAMPAAVARELEASASRLGTREAATLLVGDLWRRAVVAHVTQLARSLGLRPLASTRVDAAHPRAPLDLLLQSGPRRLLGLQLQPSRSPTPENATLTVFCAGKEAQDVAAPADSWEALLAAGAADVS